jgi:pimeloyl-ACP methyl ester carboxylesterase
MRESKRNAAFRRDGVKTPKRRRRLAAALAVLALAAAGVVAGAVWLGRNVSVAFFKTEAAAARYMAAYDAVLAKWPVAYQEITVPTRLGATHVIASGAADAPPLVLLHAAMATATVWRPNVEALSEHFRVYAVDVIGQGGRTVASRKIESRRDYADWLNDLLDGLGIARASVVGNSYGGFIALNQAAMAPERIDRVVLISPGGGFVSIMPVFRSMIYQAVKGTLRRAFGAGGPRPDLLAAIAGQAGFNEEDEDWLALGRQLMDGSQRINMIMPAVLSDAEIGAIRAPTLLLIAEHEILYEPRSTLRTAMKRMPGLEGEIVPGAHHLAAMAQPDAVNARIVNFLQAEERKTEE